MMNGGLRGCEEKRSDDDSCNDEDGILIHHEKVRQVKG
jgi:hypothetical protein